MYYIEQKHEQTFNCPAKETHRENSAHDTGYDLIINVLCQISLRAPTKTAQSTSGLSLSLLITAATSP